MVMLVTLEQVKSHIRSDVISDVEDDDLILKIHAASAGVLNYLKDTADTFVDSSGIITDSSGATLVPYAVQMATLLLIASLYANRGEDGGASSGYQMGYLPPAVMAWLYPLRDPAIA